MGPGSTSETLGPVLAFIVPFAVVLALAILSRHISVDRKEPITVVDPTPPPTLDPITEVQPPPADDENALPDVDFAPPAVSDSSLVSVGVITPFTSPARVALPPAALSGSPIIFDRYLSTRSDIGRKRGLETFGAGSGTAEAILRALRWLKLHQNPEGFWDGMAGGDTHRESPLPLPAWLC